jgi:hypothetical protein
MYNDIISKIIFRVTINKLYYMGGALGKPGFETFGQKNFFCIILNYNIMTMIGEKIRCGLLSTKINSWG